MIVTSNEEWLTDELKLVVKLFYNEEDAISVSHNMSVSDQKIINTVKVEFCDKKDEITREDGLVTDKKHIKRYAKLSIYETLRKFTGRDLQWGSLTGIRPTKLFYELYGESGNLLKARRQLIEEYYVSPKKADVTLRVVENQRIEKNDKHVDFYVNIPFCTTKCAYCSFISLPLEACKQYVEPYIDALLKEINAMKELIKKKSLIVRNIYIGGGTPTSFTSEQLDRILSALEYDVHEFTVEAGRPDTISRDKLDVFKKHNVTRISINPQSFSNKTLRAIGRSHTSDDILEAYKLALEYPFDKNMDLIAGLNGESFAVFKKSLDKAVEFNPENITVHTLSVKRTSELQTSGGAMSNSEIVDKMVDYAYETLTSNGYEPYYLYKQKNMIGNLENIGYTKAGHQCMFNINSMEEVSSIIAVGANGISKRYFSLENRIERSPNVKNLNDYITRVDEMIERKVKLFD